MLTSQQIGANIRRLRMRRGMSCVALAERTGLSADTIRKTEQGKVSSYLITYQLIAAALCTTVSALLGEEKENRRL